SAPRRTLAHSLQEITSMPKRRAFVKFALGCCLFTAASGATIPVLLSPVRQPNEQPQFYHERYLARFVGYCIVQAKTPETSETDKALSHLQETVDAYRPF